MSSYVKLSAKKGSHDHVDAAELFTPIHTQPDDSSQLPFLDFLDVDVNNEKWDLQARVSGDIEKFMDIYSVLLPPSLKGHEWKPIDEIFPNIDFIIKHDDPYIYPDLITENQHILHSEFMRSFISSIKTLYYLSNAKMFPVEYTSQTFSPSFEKERWRPWHHIYSNCKSGKNYMHLPIPNKSGKYIVRLFWMGSWKKIYISDKLPLNHKNQVLLPCVHVIETENGVKSKNDKKEIIKKKTLEIWPVLLAKALLILASLTWTQDNELVDFDIIQCLTGWVSQRTDATRLDPLDVWQTCMDHTFQYNWTSNADEINYLTNEKYQSTVVLKGAFKNMTSKKNLKAEPRPAAQQQKKTYMQVKPKEESINKNRFVVVVGIRLEVDDSQINISNWSHGFLVTQTRTVPILKPSSDEEFEAWKRYRWIDWAIERNLINPRCPPNPIRSFKTVDSFRRFYQHKLPSQVSSLTSREATLSNTMPGKKQKPIINPNLYRDVTDWLDLEHVEKLLKYVIIYYMPSTYTSKNRISNLSCENIAKELKYPFSKSLVDILDLNWKEIIRPISIQSHRNEPIYIFCDCLFNQSIVINLNQTGYLGTITERIVERVNIPDSTVSECGLCASTFLERVKKYYARSEIKPEERKSIIKIIRNIKHDYPKASLIVSKFKWDSNRLDDFVTSLTTFGTGSLVLKLPPGRHTFIMWIEVEGPYSIQIISDSCLCVGTLEETLTLMSRDSLLFREAYSSMVENLQVLIRAFGTTNYMTDLNEFYKCFKPTCDIAKKEWIAVEEVFFKEFFEAVNQALGTESVRVLKILFKKWQFLSTNRCDLYDVSQLCYRIDEGEMMFVKIMHQSAIKIQSFFRGIYERIMMSHHDPNGKFHSKTAATLITVGEKFLQNDQKLGANIMRKFIQNRTVPDLQNKYSWYETLSNDIGTAQFTNYVRVPEPGWIFIARYIFSVRTSYPLNIRINIFSNLSQYYIRVFDNDTSEEMKCFVNNVAVNKYSPNNGGYTVVAYGWATDQIYMNSKIIFACPQDDIENLISFSSKASRKDLISQCYIPNTMNLLFRYIVELRSDYTILTFHLSTDYPKVQMRLSVFNKEYPEKKLVELDGTGYIILPALVLNNRNRICQFKFVPAEKKSSARIVTAKASRSRRLVDMALDSKECPPEAAADSDFYIIEAFIEKDVWPLTASEWSNVEKERDKTMMSAEGLALDTSGSLSTHSTQLSYKSDAIVKRDSPRWTMEVYYTDNVWFYEDPEKNKQIRNTKMSWYEDKPDRISMCQELRNTFIEEHLMPNPNVCLDSEVRSLDHEIFLRNILPPFDLTPFHYAYIETGHPRKSSIRRSLSLPETWTGFYHILFRHNQDLINVKIAEKQRYRFHAEENAKLIKLNEWFDEVRKDSEYMMQLAYRDRENYINNIRLLVRSNKTKQDSLRSELV